MHTSECEKYCVKSSRGREVLERFVPFIANSEHENNAHAHRGKQLLFGARNIAMLERCFSFVRREAAEQKQDR